MRKFIFISFMLINIFANVMVFATEMPSLGKIVPPIELFGHTDIKVVLSEDEARLHNTGMIWTMIPRIALPQPEEKPPGNKVTLILRPQEDNITKGGDDFFRDIDEDLLELVREMNNPLAPYTEDPENSDNLTDEYIYMDISSQLFSYLIRYMTDQKLDIHFLTTQESQNQLYINGIEVGVRPDPFFGVRLKIQDNSYRYRNDLADNDSTVLDYGIELHLYPNQDTIIKFILEDNNTENRTGIEFNLNF